MIGSCSNPESLPELRKNYQFRRNRMRTLPPGRMTWKVMQFQSQNARTFGYVYQSTNGQTHRPVRKTQSFLLSEICTVTLWQDYCGKGNSRKFCWNTLGKKFQNGNAYSYTVKKGLFLFVSVDDIKLAGKKQNINPTWKTHMKDVYLGEPTSFRDHVYLGCTQTSKVLWIITKVCLNLEILLFLWKSSQKKKATGKPDAETISSWSHDMEGHAKKCMERCCGLANKTTQQLYKVATHASVTIIKKKKKMDQLENYLLFAHELSRLYLARIGRLDIFMVCEQTCSCGNEMDKSLWHTLSAFDRIHSSHMWIQAILVCGKHSTTLQIRTVSRLWYCRRPGRLKINIRRHWMHFRKSNARAIKLDVQETDFCFTQFYRGRGDFSRCRFTYGWDSRALDLWEVIEVFHSSPNQTNKTKDVTVPRGNLSATLKSNMRKQIPTTNTNPGSDQHWSRSIKRNTFWFQSYVVCLWG